MVAFWITGNIDVNFLNGAAKSWRTKHKIRFEFYIIFPDIGKNFRTMSKSTLIIVIWLGVVLEGSIFCFADDWDAYGKYENSQRSYRSSGPESEWPWEETLKKLGIHETVDAVHKTVSKSWQRSLVYNDFERDWSNLKSEPLNPFVLISFLRNTTLPAACRTIMHVKRGWLIVDREIMAFTRKKCDKLLGPEAPLHPWNIIKQDKETVSFIVFVYAVTLSIILIKLCSLWNFIGLMSVGYASYVLGGPHLCFRWLVRLTGLCWFLFEMILTYPLQSAMVIIILFFWSYITSLLQGVTGSNRQANASDVTFLREKTEILERQLTDTQVKVNELSRLVIRLQSEKNSS